MPVVCFHHLQDTISPLLPEMANVPLMKSGGSFAAGSHPSFLPYPGLYV